MGFILSSLEQLLVELEVEEVVYEAPIVVYIQVVGQGDFLDRKGWVPYLLELVVLWYMHRVLGSAVERAPLADG